MKTLSEKIIEQLQSKHDAFLGTKSEEQRQAFNDGLSWAIDTVETLTEIDKCEKEYEDEQLTIHSVVWQSEQLNLCMHNLDLTGKCFKCGEQYIRKEGN